MPLAGGVRHRVTGWSSLPARASTRTWQGTTACCSGQCG